MVKELGKKIRLKGLKGEAEFKAYWEGEEHNPQKGEWEAYS